MRVVDIKQEDYQVSPRVVQGASGSVVNEGVGIAQLAQSQTRDLKVASLNPGRSGKRIFFSGINFLC